MEKGSGFGKAILFGEHFVVHGVPGIVSAVNLATDAGVVKTADDNITIFDARKGTEGYTESKKAQQKESVERMLKMMDLSSVGMHIVLGGDLPVMSGIGGSAASSVAIARAVAHEFGLNYDDEQVNRIAYEMEKAYAGNPSGIDNTAATYGGLLWFQRNPAGGPDIIEHIRLGRPVEMVIGNTGKVADTKEMVAGVAKRKTEDPALYNPLFERERQLVFEARKLLERDDMQAVGKLMNENHSLLQKIGVSSKELDFLVDLALKKGAYGAKLTGGGGGGCMIALTPGKELQESVASSMEQAGFKVLRTNIGV